MPLVLSIPCSGNPCYPLADRIAFVRVQRLFALVLLLPLVSPNMFQLTQGDTQPWYLFSAVALAVIHGRFQFNPVLTFFGAGFLVVITFQYLTNMEMDVAKTFGLLSFCVTMMILPVDTFKKYRREILAIFVLVNALAVIIHHADPELFAKLFSSRIMNVNRSLQFAYPESSFAAKYSAGLAVIYLLIDNKMTKTSFVFLLVCVLTGSVTGVMVFCAIVASYYPIATMVVVLPCVFAALANHALIASVASVLPGRISWFILSLQYLTFGNALQVVASIDESFLYRANWFADEMNSFYQSPLIGAPLSKDSGGLVSFLAGFGMVGATFLFCFVLALFLKKGRSFSVKCAVMAYMFSIFMADSVYLPTIAAIFLIVFSGGLGRNLPVRIEQ